MRGGAPKALSAARATVGAVGTAVPKLQVQLTANGLSGDELAEFYHLTEGSEFAPYCVLRVFADHEGLTLAEYFGRYNLIPDEPGPKNPLGLPIGVTVGSKDPTKRVGFNCAACHVGRVVADRVYVIPGAPSAFNIRQFYDDIVPWLSKLPKDVVAIRRVAGCMLFGAPGEILNSENGSNLTSDELKVASEVQQDLRNDFDHKPRPTSGTAKESSEFYASLEEEAALNANGDPVVSPLDKLSKTFRGLRANTRRRLLRDFVKRFAAKKQLVVEYLKSLDLVKGVGAIRETTRPGPGRVDAFMTAFNLLNPEAKLSMDSPVAYPALFRVGKLQWLHWDNNTNAVMQRNIGQAVGVGALLAVDSHDPNTIVATTLQVDNIRKLETLTRKLEPPAWPFTQDTPTLRETGEKLFKERCAECHETNADGAMPPMREDCDVGTDRKRATNLSRDWKRERIVDRLARALAAIERTVTHERDASPKWQAAGCYGARSLRGAWSTAPFLHNNSVPTLRDLLTEPEKRPRRFRVDYSRYDTVTVGFHAQSDPPESEETFDTTLPGNGNGGHAYGTDLPEQDKLSLLAYLKQR